MYWPRLLGRLRRHGDGIDPFAAFIPVRSFHEVGESEVIRVKLTVKYWLLRLIYALATTV